MFVEQYVPKSAGVFSPTDMLTISAKVLANQPLAVLAEDYAGVVRIVNHAFCQLFNLSVEPEKLVGANCRKLTNQAKELLKDDTNFIETINATLKNQVPVPSLEFELNDGRFLNVEYTPCFEKNILIGHIWCYTNITDKVNKAKELHEQKIFFENILNGIPADIAVFNKEHKYIFINTEAVKNSDTRTWLIGKDDFDYCTLKKIDNTLAAERRVRFNAVIRNKKEKEWQDVVTGEGGIKEFKLRRFHPNFDENGNVSFVTGYGINISQLKAKENELMVSEDKHRKLLDQLNEIVFRLTLDKKIEFLNPAWTRILGFITKECIGEELTRFVISADQKLMSDIIENVISGRTSTISKVVGFSTRDGKIKWIKVYMAKTEKIVQLALWGTLTDITEQQIAEQELLKTVQREKELNELKSNFVNMISHEFRTPLAGIMSSVELLELTDEQFENPAQSKSAHYYELIKSQIARMTELMNNVLLLGKIEAGKVELHLYEVYLSGLCKEIIQNIFQNPDSHRTINLNTGGKEKAIQLDPNLIKNVIINLLSNALKYSSAEKCPELKLLFGRENTTIQVIDYGIGIPKPDLKKLFGSFFRASNIGNVEGTGLGLVVVKYFVELHGGSIKVQSKLGKGSVFTVLIPNQHRKL